MDQTRNQRDNERDDGAALAGNGERAAADEPRGVRHQLPHPHARPLRLPQSPLRPGRDRGRADAAGRLAGGDGRGERGPVAIRPRLALRPRLHRPPRRDERRRRRPRALYRARSLHAAARRAGGRAGRHDPRRLAGDQRPARRAARAPAPAHAGGDGRRRGGERARHHRAGGDGPPATAHPGGRGGEPRPLPHPLRPPARPGTRRAARATEHHAADARGARPHRGVRRALPDRAAMLACRPAAADRLRRAPPDPPARRHRGRGDRGRAPLAAARRGGDHRHRHADDRAARGAGVRLRRRDDHRRHADRRTVGSTAQQQPRRGALRHPRARHPGAAARRAGGGGLCAAPPDKPRDGAARAPRPARWGARPRRRRARPLPRAWRLGPEL